MDYHVIHNSFNIAAGNYQGGSSFTVTTLSSVLIKNITLSFLCRDNTNGAMLDGKTNFMISSANRNLSVRIPAWSRYATYFIQFVSNNEVYSSNFEFLTSSGDSLAFSVNTYMSAIAANIIYVEYSCSFGYELV